MSTPQVIDPAILHLLKGILDSKIEGFLFDKMADYTEDDPRLGYGVGFKVDNVALVTLYLYSGGRGIVNTGEQILAEHVQAMKEIANHHPDVNFGTGEVRMSNQLVETNLQFLLSNFEFTSQNEIQDSHLLTTSIWGFFCKLRITHNKKSKAALPSIIQRASKLVDHSMQALQNKAS